ncbi:TrmH family RNA methyltransferase [Henriciella aquimarina]|uniref:TrmH family RNA methyltransferase n=1 Tax=Henriciella aquimarina TaxID=545261 RepID=UPI000A04D47A|nr:RNA methyltransferase [Henriciella aquimarina]
MPRISVQDPADPRLAPYVSIRERDLTGRGDGRFIVEGKVTLAILAERSRFPIESVLIAESRLEPLRETLAGLPESVPVYVATQGVMDQIAGFPIHRGILACARKGEPLALDEVLGRETLLVLNDISNHDNVGAAFRNAAAFGAGGVLLDQRSCDPLYRKAVRVSAGSALWLPFHHGGTGEAHLTALHAAGYEVWALTPRADATPLPDMPVTGKVAVLLGAEGPGLPDALIGGAKPVRIPMAAGFDSVNVATAGAIAMSRIFEARGAD